MVANTFMPFSGRPLLASQQPQEVGTVPHCTGGEVEAQTLSTCPGNGKLSDRPRLEPMPLPPGDCLLLCAVSGPDPEPARGAAGRPSGRPCVFCCPPARLAVRSFSLPPPEAECFLSGEGGRNPNSVISDVCGWTLFTLNGLSRFPNSLPLHLPRV